MMADNLLRTVKEMIDTIWHTRVFIATCTGTSGSRRLIKRPGQGSADTQSYPLIGTAATNDQVLCVEVRGEVVVVGKVNA